jgi:hypothetical protein
VPCHRGRVLDDRAENASLLAYLRSRAVVPTPAQPSPWDLDEYELHTHPDLTERLLLVAEGVPHRLVPCYGVPVLVHPNGVAFAVGYSLNHLLLRLPVVPDDVELREPLPGFPPDPSWHPVDAWQTELVTAEGIARLRAWCRRAFDEAERLGRPSTA